MIRSHSVLIQSRTVSRGPEGEVGYTFATLKTIVADVQPAQLTAAQAEAWGVTDLAANTKKMFFESDATITLLMRALVGYGFIDLPEDGVIEYVSGGNEFPLEFVIAGMDSTVCGGIVYEIRALNVWPRHSEAILVPVQGV